MKVVANHPVPVLSLNRMDIRDFRLLLALSTHRHFARAAAACHLSQPAFSARIMRLEQELGVTLVARGARFEGITPEGERVLSWSRRIVALADGMMQDISEARGHIEGELRLAVIPSQLQAGGEIAAMVRQMHPGIDVRLTSRSSSGIEQALKAYDCDAGLTYIDPSLPPVLDHAPLGEERYALLVPTALLDEKAQAASQRGSMSWADAARLPLGLLNTDMQNRRIIDAAFHKAGVTVRPALESDTFTPLVAAVQAGSVAVVLPSRHAALFLPSPGIARFALTAPDLAKAIGLVSLRRDIALPVVTVIREVAQKWLSASGSDLKS